MSEADQAEDAPGTGAATVPVRLRRPLRFGELLEAVGRLYRRHWRMFLALSAVVQVPAFAATVALLAVIDEPLQRSLAPGAAPSLADARAIIVVGIALAALSHGASVLLGGLVAAGVAELDRREPGPTRAAARLWLRRLASLAIGAVLSGLAFLALLLASALLLALALAAGPAGGPIAFLLVLLAVATLAALAVLLTRWSLLVPGVVFEDLGPRAALRRSWQLVRGSTWRILGIGLLVTFAIVVVGRTLIELVGVVLSILHPVLPGAAEPGAVLVGGVVQLVVAPLLPLVYAFLFDDLASRPAAGPGRPVGSPR